MYSSHLTAERTRTCSSIWVLNAKEGRKLEDSNFSSSHCHTAGDSLLLAMRKLSHLTELMAPRQASDIMACTRGKISPLLCEMGSNKRKSASRILKSLICSTQVRPHRPGNILGFILKTNSHTHLCDKWRYEDKKHIV